MKEAMFEHIMLTPEDGFWYEDEDGHVYKVENVTFWAVIILPISNSK